MISIIRGNKIDNQFEKYMDGNDGLKMITSSPIFGFITLTNISKKEEKAFEGTLEIAYLCKDEIPFLIFKFNGLVFDSAIFKLESTLSSENALNLILIENQGNIVLNSRILGLNPLIVEKLIADTNKITFSNEEFQRRGISIQNQYEILELFEMAELKQSFTGTGL